MDHMIWYLWFGSNKVDHNLSKTGIFRNKPDNIKKLAEFIGITDYNLNDVIENSSIPATIERRKKKFEAANYPFYEMICYRKGETGSWREELSDETKRLYAEKYPNHPVS